MVLMKKLGNEEQHHQLKKDEKDGDDIDISGKKKCGRQTIFLVVFVVCCIVLFITGVVMIETRKDQSISDDKEPQRELYSAEANDTGLISFLKKVTKKEKELFDESYDPSPANLKFQTDTAWELLKEFNQKKINVDKLNLREKKAVEQVKHFLKFVFGRPYGVNYYAGDWMLGPNNFCRTELCRVPGIVDTILRKYKLDKEEDIKNIKTKLERIGKGINQLVENMKLGIRAGMVRSEEGCKAALEGLQSFLGLDKEEDVLEMTFVKNYHEWLKSNNSEKLPAATSTVNNYLIVYIGRTFVNLLNYMDTEHARYCVPSTVSSGLGSLPLDHIYVQGIKDISQPTTKRLPTGEVINGKESYEMIMPYYTTNDMTPEEVHQLGLSKVDSLYNQITDFAKNYTKQSDTTSAVEELKKKLESPDVYFANSFPTEESDKEAHRKCTSDETAKKHCPKRWATMQKWMKFAREVSVLIESKLTHLFYFTSDHVTVPTCPVELALNYNPSIGVQSYRSSSSQCHQAAKYKVPFWLDRPGPIYFEYTVNAHEARPGHHLQVQGYIEHFFESVDDAFTTGYYTVFSEGWGLYSETLMDKDTDIYNQADDQLAKYGMLRAQIWRALRLVIDTGIHFYGYKRDWARGLFEKYAWMKNDVVEKELTRYQSISGQATAYMVGQLHIYKLRNYTQQALGNEFNIQEFHYHTLSQGPAPLSYLEKHIKKFVECKKQPQMEGCGIVLSPSHKEKSDVNLVTDEHLGFEYPEHYF